MARLLTPTQRDRSRGIASALAGSVAAGAVAGVGLVTAVVANESTAAQALRATARAEAEAQERRTAEAARAAALDASYGAQVAWAAAHPVEVERPRPLRTVVDPGAIVRASAPGVARIGGSGSRASSNGSSGGSSSGSSTRLRAPAAPPPAPVAVVPPVPSTAS